jgi:hypothetical protein
MAQIRRDESHNYPAILRAKKLRNSNINKIDKNGKFGIRMSQGGWDHCHRKREKNI